jgi:hypothetical protein
MKLQRRKVEHVITNTKKKLQFRSNKPLLPLLHFVHIRILSVSLNHVFAWISSQLRLTCAREET